MSGSVSATPDSSAGDDRSGISSSDGVFGLGLETKLETEFSLLYNLKRLVEETIPVWVFTFFFWISVAFRVALYSLWARPSELDNMASKNVTHIVAYVLVSIGVFSVLLMGWCTWFYKKRGRIQHKVGLLLLWFLPINAFCSPLIFYWFHASLDGCGFSGACVTSFPMMLVATICLEFVAAPIFFLFLSQRSGQYTLLHAPINRRLNLYVILFDISVAIGIQSFTATDIQVAILCVGSGLLLCHLIRHLPFETLAANCTLAAVFFYAFFSGIALRVGSRYGLAAAAVLGMVCGTFMVWARRLQIRRAFGGALSRSVSSGDTGNAWENPDAMIESLDMETLASSLLEWCTHDYHVELLYRFNIHGTNSSDEGLVMSLFQNAMKKFPNSATIRLELAHCMLGSMPQVLFLARLRQSLDDFKSKAPDLLFEAKCFMFLRQERLSGNQERRNLRRGLRRGEAIREKMLRQMSFFWSLFLGSEVDKSSLSSIISRLSKTEDRGNVLYQRLLSEYPKDPDVLRSYAHFIADVQNDPELAAEYLLQAESLEDSQLEKLDGDDDVDLEKASDTIGFRTRGPLGLLPQNQQQGAGTSNAYDWTAAAKDGGVSKLKQSSKATPTAMGIYSTLTESALLEHGSLGWDGSLHGDGSMTDAQQHQASWGSNHFNASGTSLMDGSAPGSTNLLSKDAGPGNKYANVNQNSNASPTPVLGTNTSLSRFPRLSEMRRRNQGDGTPSDSINSSFTVQKLGRGKVGLGDFATSGGPMSPTLSPVGSESNLHAALMRRQSGGNGMPPMDPGSSGESDQELLPRVRQHGAPTLISTPASTKSLSGAELKAQQELQRRQQDADQHAQSMLGSDLVAFQNFNQRYPSSVGGVSATSGTGGIGPGAGGDPDGGGGAGADVSVAHRSSLHAGSSSGPAMMNGGVSHQPRFSSSGPEIHDMDLKDSTSFHQVTQQQHELTFRTHAGGISMRVVRDRLEKQKSRTIKNVRWQTIGILLLSICLLTGLFVMTTIVVQQLYDDSISAEQQRELTFYHFLQLSSSRRPLSLLYTATEESLFLLLGTGSVPPAIIAGMTEQSKEAFGLIRGFFSKSPSANVSETLTKPIYKMYVFPAPTFAMSTLTVTWPDLVNSCEENINIYIDCIQQGAVYFASTPACQSAARFSVANFAQDFALGLNNLVTYEGNYLRENIANIRLIVIVVASVICFLILLFLLVFTLPAFKAAASERSSVIGLFKLIPKYVVNRVHKMVVSKLVSSNQTSNVDHELDSENDKSSSRLRVLICVYLVSIGIILMMVMGFVIILIVYVEDHDTVAVEVEFFTLFDAAGAATRGVVIHLMNPSISAAERDAFLFVANAFTDRYIFGWPGLLYGNSTQNLRGLAFRSNSLTASIFDTHCNDISDVDCFSLDRGIREMGVSMNTIRANPVTPATYTSAEFLRWTTILNSERLRVNLATYRSAYQSYFVPRIDSYMVASQALYGVSFFVIFFLYFVLIRPIISDMEEENRRTSKLFLMLPPQVIDTVLPIRNYILHGSRIKRAAIEEVVRENEQKMQRILETAADGFLEFDSDGTIKQINQAAEKMMNLSTSALLGEKIFSIFSTRSAREIRQRMDEYMQNRSGNKNFSKELTFLRIVSNHAHGPGEENQSPSKVVTDRQLLGQNAESFPAKVSFNFSMIGDNSVFTCFFRDITEEVKQKKLLAKEKRVSKELLLNILPTRIASRLQNNERPIADYHEFATVCFLDIVSFTAMAGDMPSTELVALLDHLFSQFDEVAELFNVTKIKTIGDAYMAVSGLDATDLNAAGRAAGEIVEMALRFIEIAREHNLQVRIGMNTGPVTAGVIGQRKMAYDIWGDTVNVASRMESNSEPMKIQVSRSTYEFVADKFVFEERDVVLKGKGEQKAYILVRRINNILDRGGAALGMNEDGYSSDGSHPGHGSSHQRRGSTIAFHLPQDSMDKKGPHP